MADLLLAILFFWAQESDGPEWMEYQTEDGVFFWNSVTDPPQSSWGPPPTKIKVKRRSQAAFQSTCVRVGRNIILDSLVA